MYEPDWAESGCEKWGSFHMLGIGRSMESQREKGLERLD